MAAEVSCENNAYLNLRAEFEDLKYCDSLIPDDYRAEIIEHCKSPE